jgi:hypothetical protein
MVLLGHRKATCLDCQDVSRVTVLQGTWAAAAAGGQATGAQQYCQCLYCYYGWQSCLDMVNTCAAVV